MERIATFAPKGTIALGYLGLILALGGVLQSAIYGSARELFNSIFFLYPLGAALYIVLIRPRIYLAEDCVEVLNPLSRHRIPWEAIQSIETKYCLTFDLGHEKVQAWAATSPSRYHLRRVHSSDFKGVRPDESGFFRPSDSPHSDSGAAALLCRREWELRRNLPATNSRRSVQRTHWVFSVSILVSYILAILF